ncbi:MAG: pimeloyl-ACP methyl ester carboxylesterase [Halieaceae bacterium]|jgi:pimeloyl-ACP methyl ester carboxylesterase
MDAVIERGFLRLDEGLVHYRERSGDTDSTLPPLLLLHASPSSSITMEPIMAAYAPGRRLIAPDTPGNGDSVRPAPGQPGMEDYADMLDRFCDRLDLGAVDIFGSHTGAHIGVELAARRPERVRSLSVDGILVLDDAERADYLANYAPAQQVDEAGAQFHWAWQYIRDQMIFFPHFKKDLTHLRAGGIFDPVFLHNLTMDVLGSLDTYHLAYEAVFRHDIAQRLAEVSCPMRWWDTNQGYLDAGMRLMQEQSAAASVVEVAHDPAAFAAQIDIFSAQVY